MIASCSVLTFLTTPAGSHGQVTISGATHSDGRVTSQLKILGGAPEDYRGEQWATGDYSGRLGEEAHSSICPLIPPDKILTGDLWWELLRGPQWEKTNSGPRKIFIQGAAEEITPLNLPQRCIYLHINPFDLIRLDIVE